MRTFSFFFSTQGKHHKNTKIFLTQHLFSLILFLSHIEFCLSQKWLTSSSQFTETHWENSRWKPVSQFFFSFFLRFCYHFLDKLFFFLSSFVFVCKEVIFTFLNVIFLSSPFFFFCKQVFKILHLNKIEKFHF